MGPGTRLDLRLNPDGTPKSDSIPINNADYASYIHDLSFYNAKKDYLSNPTPENKKQQMQKIWKADDKFINEMEHDKNEPMAPLAGQLIKTKKYLEQATVLPTQEFSGIGIKQDDDDVSEKTQIPLLNLDN